MGCTAALAGGPVVLDPQASEIVLSGHVEWLKDDDGLLTPDAAGTSTRWQALPDDLSAGFTRAAVWLRFDVVQADQGLHDWRVEIDNSLLDDVRLYQQDKRPGPRVAWLEARAGRALAHSAWPLDTRSPTFRLDLPPGRHTVLLRFQSRTPLTTGIRLWSANHFYAHERDEALVWGLFFGMYALLGLFQFVFWIWTRDAINGWYLPYAVSVFFVGVLFSGYLQNVLDIPGGVSRALSGSLATLSLVFFAKFTSSQLALHALMPRFNRWYLWLTGCMATGTIAVLLSGVHKFDSGGLQGVWLVWMTLTLVMVGFVVRRGQHLDLVFVWAFGILLVGVVLRYTRNIGGLVPGGLAEYSLPVAAMLHMLMISLYVIYRYNALKVALVVEQSARQQQRDFVAMVSHEFRTPLAIISTSAQQITNNLDAAFDKTAKRCSNMLAATRRMTALMDDYLSLDRLETDVQPVHLQVCDLAQVLELAAAERPQGRVLLTMHDLPDAFVCDPSLLRIALHNLLGNADRHSPMEMPIELDASGDGRGGVRITVADQGEGVAVDERAKVFQKYFRGRSAQNRPGAGLGLYLVQRIATLHGGKVTVGKAAKGGALFTLTLAPP